MSKLSLRTWLLPALALVIQLAAGTACLAAASGAGNQRIPEFAELEQVAVAAMQTRDIGRSDVISQSDARLVLDKLATLGWKVPEREELLRKVLPDNDFLIGQFRSTSGKRFMHEIAKLPGALDRVDRMARLPQGKHVVGELATKHDGPKMIEYMTSQSANPRLSNMLSAAPKGTDLSRPTGKLYTLDQFIAALKKSHAQAAGGKTQ